MRPISITLPSFDSAKLFLNCVVKVPPACQISVTDKCEKELANATGPMPGQKTSDANEQEFAAGHRRRRFAFVGTVVTARLVPLDA